MSGLDELVVHGLRDLLTVDDDKDGVNVVAVVILTSDFIDGRQSVSAGVWCNWRALCANSRLSGSTWSGFSLIKRANERL